MPWRECHHDRNHESQKKSQYSQIPLVHNNIPIRQPLLQNLLQRLSPHPHRPSRRHTPHHQSAPILPIDLPQQKSQLLAEHAHRAPPVVAAVLVAVSHVEAVDELEDVDEVLVVGGTDVHDWGGRDPGIFGDGASHVGTVCVESRSLGSHARGWSWWYVDEE